MKLRENKIILTLLLVFALFASVKATVSETRATYLDKGLIVPEGTLYTSDTDKNVTAVTLTASELNLAVTGVAADYKIARGQAAVTGSATIAAGTHGLTSVSHVVATLAQDAAISANDVTTTVSGTDIVIKVWKPTGTGDCTPIAATIPKSVSWVAVGQ